MKRSQFLIYIASASDRTARDACMKTAIRLSRLLKRLGAKRSAAGLLEDAYIRFPVGARGDYGQKDLRIFGPDPEKLIADFAGYLRRRGRDHGRTPAGQPPQDALMALKLMRARRIFDPLSRTVLAVRVWTPSALLVLCAQAVYFAAAGNADAARFTGAAFLAGCAAAALLWSLRRRFLAWMSQALFYAASRRLEHEQRSPQKQNTEHQEHI
ncbi:MAG: hypothetical protein A3J79_02525 [Elusimicrobia bacterium RIFOXYB2_FULL_62_6]|nr:MAG: hypothetical protein A3J79_02525 [Elusimicrobia bacterium RIFOXYB2_FULL_62_6]